MPRTTLSALFALTLTNLACERASDAPVSEGADKSKQTDACQAFLDELCRLSSRSCQSARAAFDAEPPSPSACLQATVRVTKSGAAVDGDPEVAQQLGVLSKVARQRAAERGEEFSGRIQIRSDADATAAQLLPALLAARTGGFEELWLVAREDGKFVEMPVDVPRAGERPSEHPVVSVGVEGLHLGDERVATISELAERAELLGDRVVVRLDPTISTQSIVHVIEALRGPTCDLNDLLNAEGPEQSSDCHILMPTLTLADDATG